MERNSNFDVGNLLGLAANMASAAMAAGMASGAMKDVANIADDIGADCCTVL